MKTHDYGKHMGLIWRYDGFPISSQSQKSVDGDNPHDETHEDLKIHLAGQKGEKHREKTEA